MLNAARAIRDQMLHSQFDEPTSNGPLEIKYLLLQPMSVFRGNKLECAQVMY